MADVQFATNLLPQYQSPQQMAQMAAQTANTQANTGLMGAQTGLVGEQAQGADIANQGAAVRLGLLQNYLSGSAPQASANAPAASSSSIGATDVDPNDVTQTAFSKYAPIPTARPPSVTAQMGRAAMAGLPEVATNIGMQYDQQVAGVNQQRQLSANQAYQTAETVAAAPDGAAWDTLNRVNPQAAAALKQKYADATPEELDTDVRQFAQHIGIATHQYTGRDTDFQNGVLVDKKDGKPVLGSNQVLTGLEGGAKAQAFKDANELVTVNNSNGTTTQVPRFQTAIDTSTGRPFTSAESYYIAADKAARSSATGSTSAASAAQEGPPTPTSAAPKATAAPKTSTAPTAPAAVTTDPVLKQALSDPQYKIPTPPVVRGTTATPAALEQQKATVQAKTDLLKDSGDATQAASQSLQYLTAAKQIMDGKGAPTTGLFGPIKNEISRVYGGVDATNYAEVAKYLGNAALANAKGIYGPRMSTSEVGLQLNELSPSVHMTDDAINNLIGNNIKSAQYTIDSAKRSRAFLATGGDPQSFQQWNQQYYPREKIVGTVPAASSAPAAASVQTATGPNGQKLFLRNGQWAPQ